MGEEAITSARRKALGEATILLDLATTRMPVPIPDGSITDFVAQVGRETSAEEVNVAFKRAAEGEMKEILEYSEAPLVSSDIVGNPASCTFDSQLTMSVGRAVKVLGWYDNEWGFSNRTADLVRYIGGRL